MHKTNICYKDNESEKCRSGILNSHHGLLPLYGKNNYHELVYNLSSILNKLSVIVIMNTKSKSCLQYDSGNCYFLCIVLL